VNGALFYNSSAPLPTSAGSPQFNIGEDIPAVPSRQFSGTIDDVRIYNTALNASEVKQLYLMGK
jgi:hypothetical protein